MFVDRKILDDYAIPWFKGFLWPNCRRSAERLSEAEHGLRRILSFYLNWHDQLPDDFDAESHAGEIEETIAALNFVRGYLWDRLSACVNIPF